MPFPYEIFEDELPNGIILPMIRVPMGGLRLGKGINVLDAEIPKDFYLGQFPVTQAQWKAVMGQDNNPSHFKGEDRPLERVSWDDIDRQFLPRINKLTGKTYFLPSEVQWEYAARGGPLSKGFEYAGSNKLKEVGWYDLNSHRETQPVGLKMPNELGLHDMSGNVWEWCADTWHDNYEGAPTDGSVWIDGGGKARRVVRGGSWFNSDDNCRCAIRDRYSSDSRSGDVGFRLARY